MIIRHILYFKIVLDEISNVDQILTRFTLNYLLNSLFHFWWSLITNLLSNWKIIHFQIKAQIAWTRALFQPQLALNLPLTHILPPPNRHLPIATSHFLLVLSFQIRRPCSLLQCPSSFHVPLPFMTTFSKMGVIRTCFLPSLILPVVQVVQPTSCLIVSNPRRLQSRQLYQNFFLRFLTSLATLSTGGDHRGSTWTCIEI